MTTAVQQVVTATDANTANKLKVNVAAVTTLPTVQTLMRQLHQGVLATNSNEFQMLSYRSREMDTHAFMAYLLRKGKILNLPTAQRLTVKEQREREWRAELFGKGKPASDIVSEDRGPW